MTVSPNKRQQEPLSKSRLRLWLKLLSASNLIEDEVRRNLRDEFKSTLPRFDVMSALDRFPDGLKMSEISGLLRVSNGNVTGIVDRLTQEGLTLRIAVPGDRRASRIKLTAKGKKNFSRQASAHEKWIDTILDDLGTGDVSNMTYCLDQLIQTLEGKNNNAR